MSWLSKTVKKTIKETVRYKKCSHCRKPMPKGSSLMRTIKMANGRWVTVCTKCFKDMGSPGQLRNKKANRDATDPNQGRLW